MADHVGIGKVEDDQVVIRHAREQFFSHFDGAHLRFQIVRRHFGRRHEPPVFAWKWFLDSAIKKVSDMRVFFGLCNAQLPFSGGAHHFAQNIFEFFGRKNERGRIANIVLRERDEMHLRPYFAVEPIEIF